MISHSQEEEIVSCHDEVGLTVDTVVCDGDKSPPLAQVNTNSLGKLNKSFFCHNLNIEKRVIQKKLMTNFL